VLFRSFIFTEAANSIYRQPGKISYTILDENLKQTFIQNALAKYKPWISLGSPELWVKKLNEELDSQAQKGKVKVSGSWDEIADWMGIAPDVLKSSINQYNSFCEQEYDADFVKDKQYLLPVNTPPYYAIQCCIDCVATHGGIRVDHHLQVIDQHDNPISGLYAAGVEIGGTESETYNVSYPGHSFGFTVNSGRIAGENAAEYLSLKT
jgi:fumarate reductase flavoprotein subunit